MQLIEKILQARGGGAVERCHNIPHQGSYSVAAHSWGVAMLALQIFPKDFPTLGPAALCHDVPEGPVGDIPSPTLRLVPGMAEGLADAETFINRELGLPAEADLDEEMFAKLKFCDRLEFLLWCNDQLALGNSNVLPARNKICLYMSVKRFPSRAALRVFNQASNISPEALSSGKGLPDMHGPLERALEQG